MCNVYFLANKRTQIETLDSTRWHFPKAVCNKSSSSIQCTILHDLHHIYKWLATYFKLPLYEELARLIKPFSCGGWQLRNSASGGSNIPPGSSLSVNERIGDASAAAYNNVKVQNMGGREEGSCNKSFGRLADLRTLASIVVWLNFWADVRTRDRVDRLQLGQLSNQYTVVALESGCER